MTFVIKIKQADANRLLNTHMPKLGILDVNVLRNTRILHRLFVPSLRDAFLHIFFVYDASQNRNVLHECTDDELPFHLQIEITQEMK